MCWTVDAWEYLANAAKPGDRRRRKPRSPSVWPPAQEYDDGDDDDEDGGDDEEETIDEEPLSQIVERLDATVFGLIEALDADRADLPSFWTRRSRDRFGHARLPARTRTSHRCT